MMFFDKLNAVYQKGNRELPFKVPYLIPIPNTRFAAMQFTHMYEYNPLNAIDLTKAKCKIKYKVKTTLNKFMINNELFH